jgi:hypothetical protein
VCILKYAKERFENVLNNTPPGPPYELKIDDGKLTVWFGGHMVIGPLSRSDFDLQTVVDNMPRWKDQFGPSHIWVEDVYLAKL